MTMEPTQTVVAITGAARGIGFATAQAFAAQGANVVIGDIDRELAQQAARRLGANCAGLPLDVTDVQSFTAFMDAAQERFGRTDVLVNNAGIMPTGSFLDEAPEMTDRIIAINVHGVINGSRLAARRFAERGRGHIVNIASLAGVTGEPGVATYSGTKHFVVGFTESLHREMQAHGVDVSVVLPGVINTELSRGTRVPRWARPLACAEPEKVAAAVVAVVRTGKPRTMVPGPLGGLITMMGLLPDRTRFALTHAVKFDQLISDADPTARARYHQRLLEQRDGAAATEGRRGR